ncbi:MAG TPA: NepR family anti-sigma factor [Hyphomicrobiaceae bacterium]|jgi:Anti-sigma factor NepR|nr:NepR family anti-sigma factor [Hyphomicrobiaceae bacterium]
MAEKDGSTHLSAPAAAEPEASQQEQRKQSHQPMGQNKPYLAHSKNDREREGGMDPPMDPPRPSDLCGAPRGMLDRSLQAQLGRQLRAIFSDVAQEPVPERFIKLLEALEAREKRR